MENKLVDGFGLRFDGAFLATLLRILDDSAGFWGVNGFRFSG